MPKRNVKQEILSLGIFKYSYLSKRKEKQLVGIKAKIRQCTIMISLSKPLVVSLL